MLCCAELHIRKKPHFTEYEEENLYLIFLRISIPDFQPVLSFKWFNGGYLRVDIQAVLICIFNTQNTNNGISSRLVKIYFA